MLVKSSFNVWSVKGACAKGSWARRCGVSEMTVPKVAGGAKCGVFEASRPEMLRLENHACIY